MNGNSNYTASEIAKSTQYHSMIFTDDNNNILRDTWIDWRLIPDERPSFSAPKQKTDYIDVPGMNGSIDMSETLTGFPLYNNREGSFSFYVDVDSFDSGVTWSDVKNDISNFLFGLKRRVYLRDEMDYYYISRFTADWKSNNDGRGSTVTLNYTAQPYKFEASETTVTLSVSTSSLHTFNISQYLDVMPVTPSIRGVTGQTFIYVDPSKSPLTRSVEIDGVERVYYGIVLSKTATSGNVSINGGAGDVILKFRNGRL